MSNVEFISHVSAIAKKACYKTAEELHLAVLNIDTNETELEGIKFRARGHCTGMVLEALNPTGEWVVVNRIYDH